MWMKQAAIAGLTAAAALASGQTTNVGFEAGAAGWSGPTGIGGATTIQTTGGNPGHNMQTVFNDFGITFRTSTNPAFVQDYTQYASVTISIDIKVNDISMLGSPVPRPFLLDLRDRTSPPGGYPWVSVWYKFDDITSAAYGQWTTLSVTIDNPQSATLPPGWGGYGAEPPPNFEPALPANRTFASVLAGIDEVAFTTLEPGWFFGFTDFNVQIDNLRITLNPVEPDCVADWNDDGGVDDLDITAFFISFEAGEGDVNGDDGVDDLDITAFFAAFETGC